MGWLLTVPLMGRRLNDHNQLPKVILGVKFIDGIEVVRSQAQAAAA
jgi:putative transposase